MEIQGPLRCCCPPPAGCDVVLGLAARCLPLPDDAINHLNGNHQNQGQKRHHECAEADRICDGIHAVIKPFFKRLFHFLWNARVSVKEEVDGGTGKSGGVACHGECGSARHASTREIPKMEASQERVPRLHRYLKRLHPAGWAGFARWSSLFRHP